jgi:acetolactate synthase-1/3 small subunit
MSASLITFTVFTENHVGLLLRVTSVFTRRGINIERLEVSASPLPGIHRFTIDVSVPPDEADRLALQLEKQVEVIRAYAHDAHWTDEMLLQRLQEDLRRMDEARRAADTLDTTPPHP